MMRKKFEIGILLFAAFIVSNCGAQKSIEHLEKRTKVTIVEGNIVYPLIGISGSDTSILSLSYQFYNLDKSNRGSEEFYKDSINLRIREFVQLITEFERGENSDIVDDHFFTAQLDSFAQIYFNEEDENSNLWDLEATIEIEDTYSNFVALTFSGWSYTGGAHGNGFVSTHMIDKTDGRLLGLPDFIINVEELNKIAEPIFRKANNLQPNENLDDAGYWFPDSRFSVNDNFYFSDEMMVFYYNTYEIAPYSGGPTELIVPITEIKHLLKRKN